ncbi:hypothetical protein BHM03_00039630 [Ensete ventricosum]|nr:hypothetical protein BHM03_00039630 [Ensete ventricosum]
MSFATGALSCSKNNMGLGHKMGNAEKNGILMAREGETEENSEHKHAGKEEEINRQMRETALYATVEEEADDDGKDGKGIDLGPQVSLKDQMEKDKHFPSHRSLLHDVETLEPEVKILSLSIVSPGRPDIVLPLPVAPNSKGVVWFTLKEGSHYRLKFTFSVSNNIVSGLRYTNTVRKTGVKGKLSLPRGAPETTGIKFMFAVVFCRNELSTLMWLYIIHLFADAIVFLYQFIDDDGKCYLEMNYSFDIRREWPPIS